MTTDKKEKCNWCNKPVPSYNSVLIPGETDNFRVCLHCYNREISKAAGIEYEPFQLHPLVLKDRQNRNHEFHFSLRLMGEAQVLTAVEMKDGAPTGYEFTQTGETQAGIFHLFSVLYTTLVDALSQKQIAKDPDTGQWQILGNKTLNGRIVYSGEPAGPETPSIRIDGKKISWNDIGRMLTPYEGSYFKLQITDENGDAKK